MVKLLRNFRRNYLRNKHKLNLTNDINLNSCYFNILTKKIDASDSQIV